MIGTIMQKIILKLKHQDYTPDQLETLAKVVEEKLIGVYIPEHLSSVWVHEGGVNNKQIKLKEYNK